MNRRSFIQAILAAGMAPAVVRAESLMRCFVRRDSGLIVPNPAVIGNADIWAQGKYYWEIYVDSAPATMTLWTGHGIDNVVHWELVTQTP